MVQRVKLYYKSFLSENVSLENEHTNLKNILRKSLASNVFAAFLKTFLRNKFFFPKTHFSYLVLFSVFIINASTRVNIYVRK